MLVAIQDALQSLRDENDRLKSHNSVLEQAAADHKAALETVQALLLESQRAQQALEQKVKELERTSADGRPFGCPLPNSTLDLDTVCLSRDEEARIQAESCHHPDTSELLARLGFDDAPEERSLPESAKRGGTLSPGGYASRGVTVDSVRMGAETANLIMTLSVLEDVGEQSPRALCGRWGRQVLYISPGHCSMIDAPNMQAAIRGMNAYTTNTAVRSMTIGFLKLLLVGEVPVPAMVRGIVYHTDRKADMVCLWLHPVVVYEADPAPQGVGTSGRCGYSARLGWLTYIDMADSAARQYEGMVRDHMSLKYAPNPVTVVDEEGVIVMQNAASTSAIGIHGFECRLPGSPRSNYLQQLFLSAPGKLAEMRAVTSSNGTWCGRLCVSDSPVLRLWLELKPGEERWHDVQINRLKDPLYQTPSYIVSESDVTATVAAERQVARLHRQQQGLLKQILPQQVIDVMLAEDHFEADEGSRRFVTGSPPHLDMYPHLYPHTHIHTHKYMPTHTYAHWYQRLHARASSTHQVSLDGLDDHSDCDFDFGRAPSGSARPHARPGVRDGSSGRRGRFSFNGGGPSVLAALPRQPSSDVLSASQRGYSACCYGAGGSSGYDSGGASTSTTGSAANSRSHSEVISESCVAASSPFAAVAAPAASQSAFAMDARSLTPAPAHTPGRNSLRGFVALGRGLAAAAAAVSSSGPLPSCRRQLSPPQHTASAESGAHRGGAAVATRFGKGGPDGFIAGRVATEEEVASVVVGGLPAVLHASVEDQIAKAVELVNLGADAAESAGGATGPSAEREELETRGGDPTAEGEVHRAGSEGGEWLVISGPLQLPSPAGSSEDSCPLAAALRFGERAADGKQQQQQQQPAPAPAVPPSSNAGGANGRDRDRDRDPHGSDRGHHGVDHGRDTDHYDKAHAFSSSDGDSAICLSRRDVMSLATWHEQVTVLFADIKGFTTMSQLLHPARVMLFLDTLYNAFDLLLDECGCYKVETIGDCYMVCGGLFARPNPNGSGEMLLGGHDPQHAAKVLRFAQLMVHVAGLLRTPFGDPVSMRIGMHSGPCMSGVVGRRMPRFCLFGDTINTASRMESTGLPGAIHVSETTHSLLPDEPWVRRGDGMEVKGKGFMRTYLWDGDLSSMSPQTRERVIRAIADVRKHTAETAAAAAAAASTGAGPGLDDSRQPS